MEISRKDEADLPEFSSHDKAREYFKNKYGERFIIMSFDVIDEQNVYFYGLLLDPKAFYDGQEKMTKGEGVSGLEFMNSYQSIEIFEDGRIHVIH